MFSYTPLKNRKINPPATSEETGGFIVGRHYFNLILLLYTKF